MNDTIVFSPPQSFVIEDGVTTVVDFKIKINRNTGYFFSNSLGLHDATT